MKNNKSALWIWFHIWLLRFFKFICFIDRREYRIFPVAKKTVFGKFAKNVVVPLWNNLCFFLVNSREKHDKFYDPLWKKNYEGQNQIFFYKNQILRWFLCISIVFLGYFGNYLSKWWPLPQKSSGGAPAPAPPPCIRACYHWPSSIRLRLSLSL